MHIVCSQLNKKAFLGSVLYFFSLSTQWWLNLPAVPRTEPAHNDVIDEQKVGKFGKDFGLITVISVRVQGCQIPVIANPTINTQITYPAHRGVYSI